MKYEKRKPYDNDKFLKILDFYLFNCPVVFENGNTVSNNSKSFIKMKYNKERYIKLNNMIRKIFNDYYYCSDKKDENLKSIYENIDNNNNLKDDNYEFIIFKKHSNLNKTQSLFYCIRNAIAHNSFTYVNVNNKYVYYFESSKENVLKGMMRLKEDTLLEFIELIKKC